MKKRILSMLVVLGIFVSMLSGISVSAADAFEYDFFVDGWRSDGTDVSQIELDGQDVIKANANYTTRLIASNAFDNTLRNTTVVLSFKFMSEKVSADPEYTISQMYIKNGMAAAQDAINSTANMPGFAISGNGDFGYYSNTWDSLTNPDEFKGYGQWDTWYQIDCVYDLENGKVNYYVDGMYLGEGNGPKALNYLMFVPNMGSGKPRGNSYYKDITVREIGEFITLAKDEENSTESTIAVKLTEPLVDIADLKLYDVETFEAVDVAPKKIDEFTYSFDITGLKYGAEYKVSVPAGANGVYGNTTKASDVYFNVADESALVGTTQGTPGGQIFEDTFNRFSNSGMSIDKGSTGKTNIGVNADVDGRMQWERFGNSGWGFNTYVYANALRLDGWQYSSAMSTGVKSKINTAVTDSDVEITFDAESQNPAANTVENFFDFVVYDSKGNIHPVFQISGEIVRICKNLQYSEYIVTDYKNKNQLTENTTDNFQYHTSYKVVLKMLEGTVELYAKIDGEYSLIGTTTMNENLFKNGFSDIGFRVEKMGGGGLASYTATYINNVAVVTGPTPAPANFEDDFSSYGAVANSSSNTSNNTDNIVGDKWEKDGGSGWGANAYVESSLGNNALKIDIWQSGQGIYRGVKSKMNADVKEGVVEVKFDSSSYNPAENVYNNNFQMGVYDTTGTYYPFLHVQGAAVSYYPDLVNNDNYLAATSFTRENNINAFTSYKAVFDMDEKIAAIYAEIDGEYTKIAETTVNAGLAENGFANVGFRMSKVYSNGNALAVHTMSYVDNVEVYIKNKVNVPVVKSVRFDGKGASDAVDVDTKEIKIYFNTDMDEDTLGNILIDSAVYSGSYSYDEKAYVITVSSFLKDTDYIINVPTTVKDINGVALGREYNGVFHTEEGVFEVSSFTLKEGMLDATYADTEVGDTLTAAVTITNEAGRTGSYVLIYAIYDGNKLAQFDYVPVLFDSENDTTTESIDLTIPETENDLDVKIMLWENLSTIKPVKKAIILD